MGVISTSQIFGLTIRESANDGSDFTNPAADYRRLFLGEDGELHVKDSAGSVTGFAGTGITGTLADAQGDILVASAADTWAKLTKGANGLALVAGASTLSYVDVLPWHHVILPVWTPDTTPQGTWAVSSVADSAGDYGLYKPGSTANSGGAQSFANAVGTAQNDEVGWFVNLGAGTWEAKFWVRKSTNTAIITLNLDGASQGTVDTYAAAPAAATLSITGWTVATSGKHTISIKAATKNASSSAYVLNFTVIELHRTA
jgi:hypothetical protein